MLTYGFYNSLNHDRRYDAEQVSSIFDGIIKDGVYMAIGNHLNVIQGTGMMILVDTGRAWFNHTWTLNDARLPIMIPQSEVILRRIDAVVLEVNHETGVRANSIKVVKGTPSSNPQRPVMKNTQTVHQYPLAFVNVAAGATTIRQADITNMVGTSQTPFVTGVIQTMNIDTLVAQWRDQWIVFYDRNTKEANDARDFYINEWDKFYANQTQAIQNSFNSWINKWNVFYDNETADMLATANDWKELWNSWFYSYTVDNQKDIADWKQINQDAFDAWFNALQVTVDENIATNLANELIEVKVEIDRINKFNENIAKNRMLVYPVEDTTWTDYSDLIDNSSVIVTSTSDVEDTSGNKILDSSDDKVLGRTTKIGETILDSFGNVIQGAGIRHEGITDSNGKVIEGRMIFAFL